MRVLKSSGVAICGTNECCLYKMCTSMVRHWSDRFVLSTYLHVCISSTSSSKPRHNEGRGLATFEPMATIVGGTSGRHEGTFPRMLSLASMACNVTRLPQLSSTFGRLAVIAQVQGPFPFPFRTFKVVPKHFGTLVLERLRLPLQIVEADCECGAVLQCRHRAACPSPGG